MKKIITFSFALMASATMFAQTTLWDGEKREIGTQGGLWADGSPTVVENPEKGGINNSDKCLKFTMTQNSKVVKIPFREWITPSMDGSKRISLMIKKPQNENVQIEISDPTNNSDGYWKKTASYYSGDGKWQKIVFDFSTNGDFDYPGIMTITAQTGDVTEEQNVYIDNVEIEPATKINGELLANIPDGSLNGKIALSGAWMKGECQNADGDWQPVEYNDFIKLASKLSVNATSIDMRGTITKNVDVNGMRGDHSNVLVFADEAYSANNVVNNGKCANLVLDETKAFASPEDFNAENVSITRQVFAGKNTLCLPFYVSKEDLGAQAIATYTETEEKDGKTIINFDKQPHVDANIPFIAQFDETKETLTFKDKGVVNTPTVMGNPFIGTYTPGSAAGKYGLNADGKFQKGGETAKINAFSAYLTLSEAQEARPILLAIGGESTGINAATIANGNETVKVYNLQGCLIATTKSLNDLHLASGVYIVNNKKVIVK
ncbi:hypothetical protein [uncultured Prevotella sp.]|uniref:hypothetical protein n=1 Tax=uncultured Prevotella sp. TaxID=159272 RepID=UPI00259AA5FA|nr:hypothetical protein [uncultured Prevotella sp.]